MIERATDLHSLIKNIHNIKLIGDDNPTITGITHDSRQVRYGNIFCAINGESFNGNEFISEAISNGAVAVLTERYHNFGIPTIITPNVRRAMGRLTAKFYDNPCNSMKVFGITGTKGKTTISYILYKSLNDSIGRVALSSTVGRYFGDYYEYSFRTTPESTILIPFIASALEKESEYAVIEISSHGLAQDRVSGIELDIAIFTNLYPEHLEFHKDIERYFKAKSKILNIIKPGGKIIIDIDNQWSARLYNMAKGISHIKTIGVSSEPGTEVKMVIPSDEKSQKTIEITSDRYTISLRSPLMSAFNAENIGLSAIALIELGMDSNIVKEQIERAEAPPGRMEEIKLGQPFRVIIDYAHTPESLRFLLTELRHQIKKGRLITVFGATGLRFKSKRPVMGRIIAELSDRFIITTDDPYGEEPDKIAKDVLNGVDEKNRDKAETVLDRGEAIKKALTEARRGDMVVIAGKGHERFIVYDDKKVPFNDRDYAEKTIKEILNR